jgi:ribonuclease VapC
MIVDTSAIIAILKREPEAEAFERMIAQEQVAVSAGTLAETYIVAGSHVGERALADVDALLRAADIQIIPFDGGQARIAGDAYGRYGRGSGSSARLNYGDCLSYALAISRDEPLLFKGDDFVHTDVRRVE